MKYSINTRYGPIEIFDVGSHIIKDGLLTLLQEYTVQRLVPWYVDGKSDWRKQGVKEYRTVAVFNDWYNFTVEYEKNNGDQEGDV